MWIRERCYGNGWSARSKGRRRVNEFRRKWFIWMSVEGVSSESRNHLSYQNHWGLRGIKRAAMATSLHLHPTRKFNFVLFLSIYPCFLILTYYISKSPRTQSAVPSGGSNPVRCSATERYLLASQLEADSKWIQRKNPNTQHKAGNLESFLEEKKKEKKKHHWFFFIAVVYTQSQTHKTRFGQWNLIIDLRNWSCSTVQGLRVLKQRCCKHTKHN